MQARLSRALAVVSLLLLWATSAVAQQSTARARLSPAEVSNWREDVRFLATELPRRHKNAFARMTRAQWDSAAKRLDARIPRLARYEVIVELMRLVAMVHDGHTFLLPHQEAVAFHRLPVRMYDFADGLFIMSADSAHATLAGAKVARIGRATAAEALDSTSRLVSHESRGWARLNGANLLTMPEVLAALGLSDDSLSATLVVEQDGREQTVRLTSIGRFTSELRDNDWVDMRSAAPGDDPLWLQQPEAPFWFTILPDRTLYIGYRAVQFFANGELNETFFRRVFAAGDSVGVERVVLDMRTNGGGNNFLNRFLVREIIRRPALDQPDRFLVLIGRGVFSAAQNLVNELDYYTNATFVGEPTGNAPNQYGDPRPLELPRSHLRVFVSSLLWQGHSASDERVWFTPDVFVEITSADYRAKRDPVLETALRRAREPGLDALASDAERGDTAAVRRGVEAYRANPENRYRNIESDVNDAGYRLLRAGRAAAAVSVFQVNAALFPRSANVYDSLGEALARAGRRDEAIAAYRRALELNPNMFSSRDALRQLGATP